jgi:hypothetical protein
VDGPDQEFHRQRRESPHRAAGQQGPADRLPGPAGEDQGTDPGARGDHEHLGDAGLLLPEPRAHGDDGRGGGRGRRADRDRPEEESRRPAGDHPGILAQGG